ncbi:MAG: trypsin-like peptidase domain-containing protein [Pseudooceanicola sp.]|nr:trypsin-like peptidase domain-containing protein [Pseudooceanicola sp.]
MSRAASLRRRLAGSASGLESAGGNDLPPNRQERGLDALSDALEGQDGDVLDAARDGLHALSNGAETLSPLQEIALEAIVLSDGTRPAVAFKGDRIDPQDKALGEWSADILSGGAILSDIARACARLSTGDRAIGSGFAVAPGIIATNRHVLQEIATATACGNWTFHPDILVDFAVEKDRTSPEHQFRPAAVRFAGPDPIGAEANPALLDLALIELAPNGLADPPEGLLLADTPDRTPRNARVAVIGHPARPPHGQVADRVLFKLFGGVFGVKRFAPGLVSSPLGDVLGDADPPRVFGHDASALGGNSGSCVVALDGTWDVVGLHFGGFQQVENLAHAIARIRDDLP